jgi:hypothetical protein
MRASSFSFEVHFLLNTFLSLDFFVDVGYYELETRKNTEVLCKTQKCAPQAGSALAGVSHPALCSAFEE